MRKRTLALLLSLCMLLTLLPTTVMADDGGDAGNSSSATASEEFTITFDPEGGQVSTTSAQTQNGRLTVLPEPTREGYVFDGWYPDHNGQRRVTTSTVFNHDTTLYAYWASGFYTITLDPCGGTVSPSSVETKNGRLTGLPPKPTREGYVFDGWYTEPTGGTRISTVGSVSFKSDATLYAHWTRAYTITFDPSEGTVSPASAQTQNGKLYTLPTPTRSGYAFEGWYTQPTGGTKVPYGTVFDSDATLYARWTPAEYTITLHPGFFGGNASIKYVVTKDRKLSSLPEPTREGYVFDGWYTASNGGTRVTTDTVFDSNTNLYARWAWGFYTITLDPGRGTVSPTSVQTKNGKLISFPLPTPTWEGYTFTGWRDQRGTVTADTVFHSDTTIYAQWVSAGIYTITFDANGGSVPHTSAKTTDGKLSSLPTPTREGYTFDGWYTRSSGGSKVSTSTVFHSSTTLYARWTPIGGGYTVTFNPNGGSVSTQSAATDADGRLPSLPTPTRSGYAFDGWYTQPSGGSKISTGAVLKSDTTLYAHWTADAYTITFNPAGGQVSTTSAQTRNGRLTSLPTPTRSGYRFGGWYTEASGGIRITTSYDFEGDAAIYAHWEDMTGYLDSGSASLPKLSKQEITELLASASTQTPSDVFVTAPSCAAPYSTGQVRQDVLDAAAKRLSVLRRIAGLPAVTADPALCAQAQYGAVILGRLGNLTHTPGKPADMDQDFYQKAYSATSSSNLYAGLAFLRTPDGFMDDSDNTNVDRLGHRRWQLNPELGKVGFGYAETSTGYRRYTAEKVFDKSGTTVDYEFVSWPASGNFPNDLDGFGKDTAWSVSVNPSRYATPSRSNISVTLKRESDGKVWTFSGKESYSAGSTGKYFNVDTSGYGISNCIIFRPDNITRYDGLYTVSIAGLKTKAGEDISLRYQVNFYGSNAATEPTEPTAAEIAAAASSWAREEVELAINASIVPEDLQSNFTSRITRQEFCALMVRLVERASGQDIASYLAGKGLTVTDAFSDTDDLTVLRAYAMGIVKGTSVTARTFNPTGSITRQEAATMLARTGKLLGVEAESGQEFTDKALFGSWAEEGIAYVSGVADGVSGKLVMEGTGNGAFSPRSTYSREQAILTALRLFRAK